MRVSPRVSRVQPETGADAYQGVLVARRQRDAVAVGVHLEVREAATHPPIPTDEAADPRGEFVACFAEVAKGVVAQDVAREELEREMIRCDPRPVDLELIGGGPAEERAARDAHVKPEQIERGEGGADLDAVLVGDAEGCVRHEPGHFTDGHLDRDPLVCLSSD